MNLVKRSYNIKHIALSFTLGILVCGMYYNFNPYENVFQCMLVQSIEIIKSNSQVEVGEAKTLAHQYCQSKYFTVVYR